MVMSLEGLCEINRRLIKSFLPAWSQQRPQVKPASVSFEEFSVLIFWSLYPFSIVRTGTIPPPKPVVLHLTHAQNCVCSRSSRFWAK